MNKTTRESLDDSDDMVEWINGERITLREYDRRLQERIYFAAGKYLLKINRDCDWIFGI